MKGKKKAYIYNVKQADYYMSHGIMCQGTKIHSTTNKVYYIFDFEETEEIYAEWCNRNK